MFGTSRKWIEKKRKYLVGNFYIVIGNKNKSLPSLKVLHVEVSSSIFTSMTCFKKKYSEYIENGC